MQNYSAMGESSGGLRNDFVWNSRLIFGNSNVNLINLNLLGGQTALIHL